MRNEQYVLRLRRRFIGYECEFGCEFPNGDYIGWTRSPNHWSPTRKRAERWGERQVRRHTTEPTWETIAL